MADWNSPTLTSLYTDVLNDLKDRDVDLAKLFSEAPTNPINGMVRMVRMSDNRIKFQERISGSWTDKIIGLTAGGTGAVTAAGARTALGLGALATMDSITIPTPEPVVNATEGLRGIVELATAAEANDLSDTQRAVTPGRIPISSETQRGLSERATDDEAEAGDDNERFVTSRHLKMFGIAALMTLTWSSDSVVVTQASTAVVLAGGAIRVEDDQNIEARFRGSVERSSGSGSFINLRGVVLHPTVTSSNQITDVMSIFNIDDDGRDFDITLIFDNLPQAGPYIVFIFVNEILGRFTFRPNDNTTLVLSAVDV